MKFDKNKSEFVHQWYPFVEGYSKEFITGILEELNYEPTLCLEPFAGSGTTPVELQHHGIKCLSFEVSPFMHLLASVKLERAYRLKELNKYFSRLEKLLTEVANKAPVLPIPVAETLVEKKGLDKWIFNRETFHGILDIKYAVGRIVDQKYKNLFLIALASILLEVSNVFRNGKCVSYRTDWKTRKQYSRRKVHKLFLSRITGKIMNDIEIIESMPLGDINNKRLCYLQDIRKGIVDVPNKSIDLVITSPPYLNSRDYTDIYRLELWILDLVKDYDEMLELRKRTLVSHVQYRLEDSKTVNSHLLKMTINRIEKHKEQHWNENLIRMIKGYFRDLDFLFYGLREKMRDNKMIYFNIANSAYCNEVVRVDEIVSEIAEMNGFRVQEIRKARDLKTSGQQKLKVKSLQESVIVIKS
jgi:hypothetical protein